MTFDFSAAKLKFLIETRIDEFKLVIMEEAEIENRDETKLTAFLGICRLSKMDEWTKPKDLSINSCWLIAKIPIRASMEEIKPIVTQKHEIE